MQIDKISAEKLSNEFNVIIESPMNDNPVKYELDKETGTIFVDRFMQVSILIPAIMISSHILYLMMEILWMY